MALIDGPCDPDAMLMLWRDPYDQGVEYIYCERCGMFTPHRLVASDGAAAMDCRSCIGRHMRQAAGTLKGVQRELEAECMYSWRRSGASES